MFNIPLHHTQTEDNQPFIHAPTPNYDRLTQVIICQRVENRGKAGVQVDSMCLQIRASELD